MVGLKALLLGEKKRLECIKKYVERELSDAPEGSLRVSVNKKKVQFYRYVSKGKRSGQYIPKSQLHVVQQLAQKSYNEKVYKLVKKRLQQLEKLVKEYEDTEIEDIFNEESIVRQELIHPVVLPWEQKVEQWMQEAYDPKPFLEGTSIIITEKGERVRSKSEKILADYFYRNSIPYIYEKPLYLEGFGIIYPDFTFLSKKTGEEIYWEHQGKMDDPKYAENAVRKIQMYEKNNIFVGERLILTYETDKNALDDRCVKRLAEKYLL